MRFVFATEPLEVLLSFVERLGQGVRGGYEGALPLLLHEESYGRRLGKSAKYLFL